MDLLTRKDTCSDQDEEITPLVKAAKTDNSLTHLL
jgi:hypothetical protein